MRKLIIFLVTGILWSNVGFAEIEKLPAGTTINSLLKDGYRLFSTNTVSPSERNQGAVVYNLIKGKDIRHTSVEQVRSELDES